MLEEIWADWEASGRKKFVDGVKRCFKGEGTALSSPNYSVLDKLIYSLLSGVVVGKMKREQVVSCLAELITEKSEVANIVVDVIALIDIETQVMDNKDERMRLAALLRDLNRYLSEELVKERIELELLGESAILKNPKKFFNTVIKLKTKLFYKQQKFNLFREESEGYAKLITDLNQDLDKVKLPYILQSIHSLIGYFNLDPNRVLDIILESFEKQPHQFKFFIDLLKEFLSDRDTLKELLHFKYSHYSENSEEDHTPESLYTVTALLIIHDILTLDDVYSWLSPSDATMGDEWSLEVSEAKAFLRKMTMVSTKSQDDDEKSKEKDAAKDSAKKNQKFGLLTAFYKLSNWGLAEKMLANLPRDYCISQPAVSRALCSLAHRTLDPVYQQYNGLTSRIKHTKHEHLPSAVDPPLATTLEEMRSKVYPMLKTLGPYAYRDPTLLYRVLRILKTALGIPRISTPESDAKVKDLQNNDLYYDAMTLLQEVILPSLSLMNSNCCLAEEVWSLMRHMPYQHRYRLYDGWKNESMETQPLLIRLKGTSLESVKRILKKMAKENVKHTGRQLGKLSHGTPGIIFAYVCQQVQIADNLIGPIVDSMKYMTNLSFDILGFCIIESLADPAKNRTKTDGTSISMWLTNLAMFCGCVYKKYNIELTGLLQYVANQLKAKNSLDLLIVKEVVNKMGGIEAVEEMTAEQLEAFSGGELLRQEAGNFNQVKNTRKSSQRLKECLMEMNLAVPLVLLMAQQGSCVVYQETEEAHLKLVGKLFDQCHDTLVQFGTFLANNLSQDDYSKVMPPLPQLLSQFYVNPDIAFFLARPMFNHLINGQFEDIRKSDKQWRSKTPQEKQAKHAEAARMIMEPLTRAVVPVYPSKIWDDISPEFLSTFWSLTIYDLYVPEQLYAKKIKQLKEAPNKLHDNRDMTSSKRKKEVERLNVLVEKLQDEEKKHREHVERVMTRLKQEKDNWFLSRSAKTAKNETITQFLQFCLFPRSIFTANDASYAAKFVKIIHQLKTPNFSTLILFDRTFCDITYTVTSCTENEATRYGRFLCAMLETARRWHKDKQVFEAECSGYPGFITKFKATSGVEENAGGNRPLTDFVDFENYRHVCHKWHYKIAKALVVCLESKDFVQIRNALIILNEIISQYPLIQNLGHVLEKRVEKVCQEEKENRKDLYIKASSYQGKLLKNRSRMVKEYEFHLMKGAKPESEEDKAKNKDSDKAKEDKGKDENNTSKEEGEINEERKERKSKDRDSKSRDRDTKSRDRDTKSRDRETQSRDRETKSRDRESRDRTTDMGPPASRMSVDPGDSDRDFKRKRDSAKDKKKDKSPDRLEKKEKARKERQRKEQEEAAAAAGAAESSAASKKDRKRDRETSSEQEKKKRRGGEEEDLIKQNGDSKSRKSRR